MLIVAEVNLVCLRKFHSLNLQVQTIILFDDGSGYGEISAADVFDLTKSYKSLDKVLKNNKMTANGLAEILE